MRKFTLHLSCRLFALLALFLFMLPAAHYLVKLVAQHQVQTQRLVIDK